LGPPALGYLRASALDVLGSPVPGVSIHIDNRLYVTEPQVTGADGAAVLEVSLTVSGSTDTATVTALPPEGYRNPPSQPVTIVADDTVDVGFALQAE
jgi:hypothetical protein